MSALPNLYPDPSDCPKRIIKDFEHLRRELFNPPAIWIIEEQNGAEEAAKLIEHQHYKFLSMDMQAANFSDTQFRTALNCYNEGGMFFHCPMSPQMPRNI